MFRSGSGTDIVRVDDKTQLNICGDELYGCELCSEGGWTSETEVEIHKSLKHTKLRDKLIKRKTVCSICIKDFGEYKDLVNHIKTEHLYSSKDAHRVEREIFVCDDCCDIFFNKGHLVVHITRNHTNDYQTRRVECPQCGMRIKCKSSWHHFHKHMLRSISTCRFCFLKCKNRRELRNHINSHRHYYKCDMCGYYSKNTELFNWHITHYHKRKDTTTDGTNTTTGKYLEYFIPKRDVVAGKGRILTIFRGVSVANGVKICILCREICVHYRQMQNHIMYDHLTQNVPVKCEYKCTCGTVYSNKILLKQHLLKEKGDHGVLKENDQLQKKWERFISVEV